jgi:hypothetical protein
MGTAARVFCWCWWRLPPCHVGEREKVVDGVRHTRDGRVWDEKEIVQFRRIGGAEPCVVYGPYGIPSEVKP